MAHPWPREEMLESRSKISKGIPDYFSFLVSLRSVPVDRKVGVRLVTNPFQTMSESQPNNACADYNDWLFDGHCHFAQLMVFLGL